MTRALSFDAIESSVLTACIVDADIALPLVSDLESEDFASPFRRAAFDEVRNLQAAGERIDVLAVADALFARWQLANDGRCTVHDDIAITVRLACMFLDATKYGADLERALPRHALQLRVVAEARRLRLGA